MTKYFALLGSALDKASNKMLMKTGHVSSSYDWATTEPRQYGLIAPSVYITYLKCGGLSQVSIPQIIFTALLKAECDIL